MKSATSVRKKKTLLDEVNEKRMEIRTDGYPMSIGEWISLYEQNELDIHPEFQRFFRWSEEQKTSLIESILLGIPIPPVFVSQRGDGIWDVVDGLQRLSTIFQLLGILKDEKDRGVPPLILGATKYLPSLKDVKWDNHKDKSHELPSEAKLIIKRSKISVSIVLKESDKNAKFDLFQRLNTGGSELSPQEVRNCVLVMLNPDMYTWLKKLTRFDAFQECISLSDRPLEEAYDVELALRFIVFSRISNLDLAKGVGDVGDFLTERMKIIAADDKFPRNQYESDFERTFQILYDLVGANAFKRYSTKKSRHEGGFLLSQYEVVALGIAYNLARLPSDDEITVRIQDIWKDKNYTDWAGSGITATRRLPHLIPLGRKLFTG
jgi:Protein of unknown function DUF262